MEPRSHAQEAGNLLSFHPCCWKSVEAQFDLIQFTGSPPRNSIQSGRAIGTVAAEVKIRVGSDHRVGSLALGAGMEPKNISPAT